MDAEGEHLNTAGPRAPGVVATAGRRKGIEPGRELAPALLNDPDVVKWPTLDKSLWEKHQSAYKIVPRK
ncbi:MAG: hypothetical protein DCC71_03840 [Proteobacteria bacterium]|nr:MAG: hypothetical protein DCC71_03840 [Pseudomonadota bacterium]